jgi:hypothetical protein
MTLRLARAPAVLVFLLAGVGTAAAADLHTPTSAERGLAARIAANHGMRVVGRLGSGNNQHAWRVEPHGGGAPQVLKLFQSRTPETADSGVREELANIAENTARLLRNDPEFSRLFGTPIPHAQVAAVGATLQDFVTEGVPLGVLPKPLREVAAQNAATAIALARAQLGGLRTSTNLDNFLFEPESGRIAAWFDHLSHSDLGQHLAVARARGYGRAPQDLLATASRPDGSLLRDPADGAVFLLRAGRRWHVPDPETFTRMGLRWQDVQEADPATLASIPVSRTLPVLRAPRMPTPRESRPSDRPARWYALTEELLSTGAVVHKERNGTHSANKTWIVTLRGATGRLVRAIWKPVSGERATIGHYPADSPFAGSAPYPLTRLFLNEVRTSRLAAALGLHFLVPPTIERTIDGVRGSLQLMVEDAASAGDRAPGERLDRATAEKLRVFDFMIGNADRMASNLLVRRRRGRIFPVAIDNALTFPHGTTRGLEERPFPTKWLAEQLGPLLPSTRAFIASIDPATVARVLSASGAEPRQTAHVLRRLERIKRDPDLLAITRPGPEGLAELLARTAQAAHMREQGLSPPELDAINRIIAASATPASGR